MTLYSEVWGRSSYMRTNNGGGSSLIYFDTYEFKMVPGLHKTGRNVVVLPKRPNLVTHRTKDMY
jgi:hypothetical protein